MAEDLSGSPERALWLAVITQAAIDAEGEGDFQNKDSLESERRAEDEACAFLVHKGGEWAEAREAICSVVDIDPDRLRERALAGPLMPSGTTIGSILRA